MSGPSDSTKNRGPVCYRRPHVKEPASAENNQPDPIVQVCRNFTKVRAGFWFDLSSAILPAAGFPPGESDPNFPVQGKVKVDRYRYLIFNAQSTAKVISIRYVL